MQTKFTHVVIVSLAGIALFATAAPAAARESDPTMDRANANKPGKANVGKRYCVDTTMTGSRVPRRTCKTAADWARDGVDIVKEAERGARR